MSHWYPGTDPLAYTVHDHMSENEDRYSERAKFAGSFAKHPELLSVLEGAGSYADAKSTEQWLYEADNYPISALAVNVEQEAKFRKRLTRFIGKDAAVRAYVLSKAVGKLLEVVGAPAAMIADLNSLLSDFAPRGSEPAEKVQRTLINRPTCTENISKLAEADDVQIHRATIHDMLARGVVKKSE